MQTIVVMFLKLFIEIKVGFIFGEKDGPVVGKTVGSITGLSSAAI
jgi:hypothetical protein